MADLLTRVAVEGGGLRSGLVRAAVGDLDLGAIVSPPDAATDAEPDETWTPYPQNFVFWNLQHASRLIPPRAPSPPLRLHTGLAGGIGDRINDALLSFVNDQYAEAEAFLNQADASGMFWST